MLNFFRRYQRVFFIIVTITIVVSFTFFGTYSAIAGSSEAPNKVIGKGIDGSEITQREFGALYQLIATSPLDHASNKMPNLLNDSVIQKDLMGTGMAMILARSYFEELRSDLEIRLTQIKNRRLFVHPQMPHLNVEAIWQRFHPTLAQHLAQLKTKSDQLTMETLALMFQVYLDQAQFPADLVKQVMLYQMQQQGIAADPAMQSADFSLFGFKSLEDWFGSRFVHLSSQFIWNAALVAEKHGYKISNEEVRAEISQNIAHGFKEISPRESLSAEEMEHYYAAELRHLGVDESTLINSWRRVMLFRRLFNDVGNSVFLDPLSFKQFQAFSKDSVEVDLYELPEALRLKDLRALFRLQVYVDAVARDPSQLKGSVQLPTRLASLEVLEKRAPELIEQAFDLEFAQVDRQELMRQISLKETWEWETRDGAWDMLKREFPALAQGKAQTVLERDQLLDQIESKERLKIDQFAREKMLDAQPEKLVAALNAAEPQKWSGFLRAKGGAFPIAGVEDQQELVAWLSSAPVKGEEATAAALIAQGKLNGYSPDGKQVMRLAVLSRQSQKQIVPFSRALYDGTLDQMLDHRLEAAYPEVRRKHATTFQQKDGTWRPFVEVKEAVGKIVYADLLKSIEEGYRSLRGELPGTSGDLPSTFYTQYRLLAYIEQAKGFIEKNGADSLWVRVSDQEEERLDAQWKLLKTTRTVERGESLGFSKEKMFASPIESWSSVEAGHGGALAFYRVVAKAPATLAPVSEMNLGHQALSIDARRSLMGNLLEQMRQKNVIDLSMGENL